MNKKAILVLFVAELVLGICSGHQLYEPPEANAAD